MVRIDFGDALRLIIAISVGRKMRESDAWRPRFTGVSTISVFSFVSMGACKDT